MKEISNSANTIDFLGIQVSIVKFLLIAGGIAVLVFLLLLVILLLMYLRKRLSIKGYLGYENEGFQLEDKILQIESEINQIQKKFYINRQYKKNKKYFKS